MAETTMMALCRARGEARLERRSAPKPARGEAHVRVLLAGVCRTDLYAANGVLPVAEGRVLGHELVAEVITSSRFAAGTRVTAYPWIACGSCVECAAKTECTSTRVLGVDVDGAFAEELCIDDACLHEVSRGTARAHHARSAGCGARRRSHRHAHHAHPRARRL